MFGSATDPQAQAAKLPQEPQAIADAVMHLLAQAGHAVQRDQREALRCIEQASSLTRRWGNGDDGKPSGICRGGLAPWQMQRVRQFVEDNLASALRIGDLAQCICLSTSYFFLAFRQSLGKSPHVYVTEQRIKRAQRMMLETEQSLSQIALDCGLADQPHLTRLFNRYVGISPAAWRRAHRVT